MAEDKTEKDIYRELLQKESNFIEVFNRLSVNPDFKVWENEFIEQPLKILQNTLSELDFEKDINKAIMMQSQIKVLKQQKDVFQRRRQRKQEVNENLKELK